MDDQSSPTPECDLVSLVSKGPTAETLAAIEALPNANADARQTRLRSLRELAEANPAAFDGLVEPFTELLTAAERPGRLTTAKLFVAVAEEAPDAVVPAVPALAERLADEAEFYFVKARCAEALGYVAVDHPEAVASPEILADLRIGLEFDEPEVREKLAKALAHVTFGDPGRLRHHVGSLAAHLDAENELTRYHLTTALVVTGCAHPVKLSAATDELIARLNDDCKFVRGRAAEALGLLARAESDFSFPVAKLRSLSDDSQFIADRANFALSGMSGVDSADTAVQINSVEGIRERTDTIVAEIQAPDTTDGCPHCGVSLPDNGPPMCPACGTPL